MNNRFVTSKILISFIVVTGIFNVNTLKEPEKSIEREEQNYLADKEVELSEKAPNQIYVYLDKEIINYFNELNLKRSSVVEYVPKYLNSCVIVTYDFALNNINQAIKICRELDNLDYLNIFENYKLKLEKGENLIIEDRFANNKYTQYYDIKTKNKLDKRPLYVINNSKIYEDLYIMEKNLNLNAATSKKLSINGNSVVVSALPKVNDYGLLNGQATLSFPENFIISNNYISGKFKVIPEEDYITIPNNKGTLTGYNLTDDDPLIQLLNSLEFQCGTDHFSINPLADKLFLYALNLSFNVEIRNTSFDKSRVPKINITFENLPVSLDPALFQFDPFTAEDFEDDLFLNESDSQICYACPNIHICKSLDLDNITRAFTKKLAAIRAVISSVNNISVNSRGTLSFTVNISVLAYDTESDLKSSLPTLSLLISQFFENSSIVFTVTGKVTNSCI